MVMLAGPRSARAQAGPPPKPSAGSAKTVIDAYVGYYILQLNAADTDTQQKARDAIVGAAPTGASAGFYGDFDGVLDLDLSTMLSNPQSSIRARICAGFVCWKIAAKTGGEALNLAKTDQNLLGDPAPAVQAYGLKAAAPIIMAMLSDPTSPPVNSLAGALIKAVRKDTPALMVDDAWHALTPDLPAGTPADAKPKMVPFVQQFLEERKDHYINGAPNSPTSDSLGVLYLCSEWSQQSKADKTASMQAISDLIAVAGQRANTNMVGGDLAKYAQLLDRIYRAFDQNSSAIAAAMPMVAPLKGMELAANKQTILAASKQVSADLCKGSTDWSPLTPPPSIVVNPPAGN
jgi:hypothetical protein